jgi:hypothetical protein
MDGGKWLLLADRPAGKRCSWLQYSSLGIQWKIIFRWFFKERVHGDDSKSCSGPFG